MELIDKLHYEVSTQLQWDSWYTGIMNPLIDFSVYLSSVVYLLTLKIRPNSVHISYFKYALNY